MGICWLVLDANYLCRRAFHAMPSLTHRDVPTAVLYGLLRDVASLQERFLTPATVFCFDRGRYKREEIYPGYKAARRLSLLMPEQEMALRAFRKQVNVVRDEHLGMIGYRNVLCRDGYEADDVAAAVCGDLDPGETAIVVSEDQDFYQLLSGTVSVYHPRKAEFVTEESFTRGYGVSPADWVTVKAVAGCRTDGVLGVKGVGEATALRYVRRELPGRLKTHKDIVAQKKQWRKNVELVKLPFAGVGTFPLQEDEVTAADWDRFCRKVGFTSLLGKPPFGGRVLGGK